MKRVWGHFLAGFSLVACAVVAATACVQDDSTIFVDEVISPTLVTPGGQCMYTSDPTQLSLPSGTLDLAISPTHSYQGEFLIANQIVPRGDPTQPQTETSYVVIQGAVVRITDSTGHQLSTYTQLGSVTIPPALGNAPSYAAIGMTIVDEATADSTAVGGAVLNGDARTLITYTKFFGQTLGGEPVQTAEYEFPVAVCYGCLISFSAADIDPTLKGPNCQLAVGTTSSSNSSLPVPCQEGQDAPIDCSECLSFIACYGAVPPSTVDDAGAGGG